MTRRFENKTVLITGTRRGIGKGLARCGDVGNFGPVLSAHAARHPTDQTVKVASGIIMS